MSDFNPSYIKPRRSLLKHVIGKDLLVLDVGCATGENGKYLLERNIASEVYGFEIDAQMADVASSLYQEVYVGDLDELDIGSLLQGKKFDYIILGDVLEHLKDPWGALRRFSNALSENGKVVLSLPNIQHIDVFIHVFLKGIWPHNDRGIFDKTHLRFFTLKTMKNLIFQSGLTIENFHRSYRRRDKSRIKLKHSPIELVAKIIFKNLYTYQFIFVCSKSKQ